MAIWRVHSIPRLRRILRGDRVAKHVLLRAVLLIRKPNIVKVGLDIYTTHFTTASSILQELLSSCIALFFWQVTHNASTRHSAVPHRRPPSRLPKAAPRATLDSNGANITCPSTFRKWELPHTNVHTTLCRAHGVYVCVMYNHMYYVLRIT